MTRITFLVTALLALAGCSLLPGPPSSDYDIVVSNGTTLPIAVIVNGRVVRVFGAGESTILAASTLGQLPWRIEARTPSGRVLTDMTVTAGSTGCTHDAAADTMTCRGSVGQVDLSCGRFSMYTNGQAFSGGPAPGPGQPGDCEP